MKLIYIYDPVCGWCYAFTPVVQELVKQHPEIEVEVLSGGMILGAHRRPASAMYNYIKDARVRVEELSGIKFGDAFIEGYLHTEDLIDSEKPCVATTVFKQYLPAQALDFAHDLQYALKFEGKSLNEDATYVEVLKKYNLPAEEFLEKMGQEENRYATHAEFQQVQAWGITGFPAAILEAKDQLFLIAKGFTPLERLEEVIEKIKAE
jgi:putative protein-disulfide isomerase